MLGCCGSCRVVVRFIGLRSCYVYVRGRSVLGLVLL